MLAILRGEKEGHLSIKLEADSDNSTDIIRRRVIKRGNSISKSCEDQIEKSIQDAYKRLLNPSIKMKL